MSELRIHVKIEEEGLHFYKVLEDINFMFEAAANFGSNRPKKKPSKGEKKAPAEEGIKPPVKHLTEGEVQEMLDKMHSMSRELNEKIETACDALGQNKEETLKKVGNPQAFKPHEWAKVEEKKEVLEQKIADVLGKGYKKVADIHKSDAMKKKLRGKTLGSRKNWIPIP